MEKVIINGKEYQLDVEKCKEQGLLIEEKHLVDINSVCEWLDTNLKDMRWDSLPEETVKEMFIKKFRKDFSKKVYVSPKLEVIENGRLF